MLHLVLAGPASIHPWLKSKNISFPSSQPIANMSEPSRGSPVFKYSSWATGGPGGSVFRRHRHTTDPCFLDPRAIRSFDLLEGVTFHFWRVICIAERIGESKKWHSRNGPHRPCLRGSWQCGQAHHAQTNAESGGCAKLDHFQFPRVQDHCFLMA